MKLQFSELLFFSALYWSIVIGSSTINSGLNATKSITTKTYETSFNSSNSHKENENIATSGNEFNLTLILPDTNNTAQTNIQTDIKKINKVSEKTPSINKTLSVSQYENNTNKVSSVSSLPAPAPELGKWIIKNNERICIIVQMIMQLNITYPSSDNKGANITINGPGKNSTAYGSCLDLPETINITWGDPNHSLEINFKKNNTANDFYISGISVNVNATILPNVKANITFLTYNKSFAELFETPLGMSYKCGKMQTLNLSSLEHPKFNAVLTLRDTQFQAFMNNTNSDFGIAQDCDTFDTPDIVPIAVGTALAVLVVVVLIAYLVGRRRSQNRGYLSM